MFNAYYLAKRYETATVVDGVRFEQYPAIRRRRPPWRRRAA
jgi:hypothetical protein